MKYLKLVVCFVIFLVVITCLLLMSGSSKDCDCSRAEDELDNRIAYMIEAKLDSILEARSRSIAGESQRKQPEKPQKPKIDENGIKEFFENVVETLKKDALTFEEVKRLYAEYAGKSDEWKKAAKELLPQDVSQLEAYKTVVDVLTLHPGINYYRDKDKGMEVFNKIKDLNVDNATLKRLNKAHREDVLGIYWGFYKRGGNFVEYLDGYVKVNGRNRLGKEDGLIFFINNREKTYVDFKALDKLRNVRAVPQ